MVSGAAGAGVTLASDAAYGNRIDIAGGFVSIGLSGLVRGITDAYNGYNFWDGAGDISTLPVSEVGVSDAKPNTEGTSGKNPITINSDGTFNENGKSIAGYVKNNAQGSSVHVGPAYVDSRLELFKSVAGHELGHAWHYSLRPQLIFNEKYSETACYGYSIKQLGFDPGAQMITKLKAMELGYLGALSKRYAIYNNVPFW